MASGNDTMMGDGVDRQESASNDTESARNPLVCYREQIVASWVDLVVADISSFAELDRTKIRQAVEAALSTVLRASTEGFSALDDYLRYIDAPMNHAGITVGEITRAVIAGVDAFDRALPQTERYSPAALDAERCLRELVSRSAERAVDVFTARLAAEARAQAEARNRLVALQRIGAAVTSALELDTALQSIVDEAVALFGAASARLRLADESGETLKLIATAGEMSADLTGLVVPIDTTLSGLCYRTGMPVVSSNVPADPRADPAVQQATQTRSLLCVPLLSRGSAIGVLSIANRVDTPFAETDSEMLSLLADHAATAIVNGRLFEQAQEQITGLEILNRVSAVVSASLELDTVYGAIHQEIARIMIADAFLIMLRGADGEFDLVYIVDEGVQFTPRHNVTVPRAYQEVIERREPRIIEADEQPDFANWERFGDMRRRVQSLLVAPLLRGGEAIGLISTQSYVALSYRPRDLALFMTIANVAAVAIENARLFDQAHGLAVAEERNRLAREIHDTLAQGLVGIILQLDAMGAALERESALQRRVQRALELARVNLDEARRSVRDLRASPLAQQSLVEALRQLAREHEQDCDAEVYLSAPTSMPQLEPDIESALFRLAQEALTNCRKHAAAERVWIDLALDDAVRLSIADNGVGFDIDAWRASRPAHRFGLHGMLERVERMGGSFSIQRRPGGGTIVAAYVPFEARLVTTPQHPAS